ncbi:hypothetical protein ONS96_007528 [Cadophora gregata f. sp. sojae]|nr:hypothetical protein ONS96_007528 [Cadophora gregata f. sp. sojae]
MPAYPDKVQTPTRSPVFSNETYNFRPNRIFSPSQQSMKMRLSNPSAFLLFMATRPALIHAGPVGYGICKAGCASIVTACYAAAGATWGATLGATAPATVVACNTAFGICQGKCAVVALLPTP